MVRPLERESAATARRDRARHLATGHLDCNGGQRAGTRAHRGRTPRRGPDRSPTPLTDRAPVRTYLALGANLGDRGRSLDRAEAAISALPETVIALRSQRHETPALLPAGAPPEWNIPFLNAVVAVDTTLTAHGLLARAKRIELELGRHPGPRWGPREVDIDLLAYGDRVIADGALVVPHRELASRRFVLAPWAEIAPEWCHPVTGRSVADMLEALG